MKQHDSRWWRSISKLALIGVEYIRVELEYDFVTKCYLMELLKCLDTSWFSFRGT
jgi:hypothetical protein